MTHRPHTFRRIIRFITRLVLLPGLLLLLLIHLPPVQQFAGRLITRSVSSALLTRFTIDSLSLNLFTLHLSIDQISITSPSTDPSSSLSIPRIDLNLGILKLLTGRIHIDSLSIDSPRVTLRLTESGSVALPFTIAASETPAAPSHDPIRPPPITLGSIALTGAHLTLIDATDTTLADLRDLTVTLSGGPHGGFSGAISSGALESIAGNTPAQPVHATIAVSEDWKLGTDIALALPGLGARSRIDCDLVSAPIAYHLTLTATADPSPWLDVFHVEGLSASPIELAVDARSTQGPIPSATVSIDTGELAADALSLEGLTASVTIDEAARLRANARIPAGGGDLSATADIDLNAFDSASIGGAITSIDLAKALTLPDGTHPVSGLLNGAFSGRITLKDPMQSDAELRLRVDSGGLPSAALDRLALTLNAELTGGRATIDRLTARHGLSRIDLTGALTLPDTLSDVALDVALPDLSPYLALAGMAGSGAIDLKATAGGSLQKPTVTATGAIRALAIGGAVIDVPEISARFDQGVGELRLISPRIPSELPDLTLRTAFEPELSASIASSDGSLRASLTRDASGGQRIRIDLADFALERLQSFLSGPGAGLTGRLTAGADIAIAPDASPAIDAVISNLDAGIDAHGVTLSRPATIRMHDGTLSASAIDLLANDGTTMRAALESLRPDGTFQGSIRFDIPDLAAWRSIAGLDDLSGSMRGDFAARGTVREPILNGRIDGESLRALHAEIDSIAITASPGSAGGTNLITGLSGVRYESTAYPDLAIETSVTRTGLRATARAIDAGAELDAALEPLDSKRLELSVRLDDLAVERFAPSPPDLRAQSAISGRLAASVRLDDPLQSTIDAQFTKMDLSTAYLSVALDRPAALQIDRGRIETLELALRGDRASIDVSGGLPFRPDAPGIEGEGITARISLDASAAESLQSALDHIEGRLDADLRVTGSLVEPLASGRLTITGGIVDSPDLPSRIDSIEGRVELVDGGVSIDGMTARFADGRIEFGGRSGGLTGESPLDFTLRVRGIRPEISPELNVELDSDIALTGTIGSPAVRGEIRVLEGLYSPKIDIIGILNSLVRPERSPGQSAQTASSPMDRLTLDLTIIAPDSLRIDNPYLELDLGTRLQVIGTASIPGVMGSVSILDGYLDLLRTEFEIDRGSVVFTDPWRIDPEVDISATAVKGAETIYLKIAGRASRPLLQLSSSGGLTHTEIVKLLAGVSMPSGGSDSDLTGLALQYATNSAALVLADYVSAQTGLILIPFPTGNAGEKFLFGAGKRLGDRVLIMYFRSQSDEGGDAIEFEFNLTQDMKLRARRNPDGTTSGGLRYRYDFH